MKKTKILALLMSMAMLSSTAMPGTLAMESAVDDGATEYVCGFEEHTHDETCWEAELTCTEEESAGHTHGEDCYTVETVRNCDLTEEPHECTEECEEDCGITVEHVHGDECPTEEKETLTCELAETEGHAHGEGCYGEAVLTCTTEVHTHTDECLPAALEIVDVCPDCGVELTEVHRNTCVNYVQGSSAEYIALCGSVVMEAQAVLESLELLENPEEDVLYDFTAESLLEQVDGIWTQIDDAEAAGTVTTTELDMVFAALEEQWIDLWDIEERLKGLVEAEVEDEEEPEEDWGEEEGIEDDWIEDEYEEEYIPPVDYTEAAPVTTTIDILPERNEYTGYTVSADLMDHEDIHTSKTITYDDEDGYTIKLEAFLEGVPETTEPIPSDMVLVIDQSTSMAFCMKCNKDHNYYEGASYADANHELDENKTYYVLDKDLQNMIPVYYCSGTVQNADLKCGHGQPGWFSKEHFPSYSTSGTRFVPSIGNCKPGYTNFGTYTIYTRIFYTDSTGTTPCLTDQYSKDGYYLRDTDPKGVGKQTQHHYVPLKYCENHAAWHDEGTACSTTSEIKYYVPRKEQTTGPWGSARFLEMKFNHKTTSESQLDTSLPYYVKTKDVSTKYGDYYSKVTYNTTNGKWVDADGNVYTCSTADNMNSNQRIFYCDYTRYDMLRDSLKAFTEDIYTHSIQYNLKNRIAITSFAEKAYSYLQSYLQNDVITPLKYADVKVDDYRKALHNVLDESGQQYINDAIDTLIYNGGGTATHLGMDLAVNVLKNNAPFLDDDPVIQGEKKRNKIVILFTDGYPASTGTDAYGGADMSLKHADTLKKDGIKVYTVGVFSGANGSDKTFVGKQTTTNTDGHITGSDSANKFMQLVSSNYIPTDEETTMGKIYDPGDLKTGHYLTASDPAKLIEAFRNIAKSINYGTASLQGMDESTQITDTLSDYFVLDETRDVQSYTLACIGQTTEGTYSFSNQSSPIQLTLTEDSDKKISYTGFDFTENYVAINVDHTNGNTTPRGNKLVIEIPVVVTEEAKMGGINLPSNVQIESGLFPSAGDGVYENFDLPHVDIPTTVTVTKNIIGGTPEDFKFEVKGLFEWNKTYTDTADGTSNYLSINTDPNQTPPTQTPLNVTDYRTSSYGFTLGNKSGSKVTHSIENVVVGSTIYFKEEVNELYDVKVVVDGTELTAITSGQYSGYYEINVLRGGMTIEVTNTYKLADLTIEKSAEDVGKDENQSFIFHVKGIPDTATADVDVTVVVVGGSSVTISQIPVGNYKVTENSDWSWRYTLASVTDTVTEPAETQLKDTDGKLIGATVYLPLNNNTVTFTNTRDEDQWLSGDCYVENWFKKEDNAIIIKKRNGQNVIQN